MGFIYNKASLFRFATKDMNQFVQYLGGYFTAFCRERCMETPLTGIGITNFMVIQIVIVVDVHSPTNGVQFFADDRNGKVVA
jgi:hypothetical protein